jgi:hypothetical protein
MLQLPTFSQPAGHSLPQPLFLIVSLVLSGVSSGENPEGAGPDAAGVAAGVAAAGVAAAGVAAAGVAVAGVAAAGVAVAGAGVDDGVWAAGTVVFCIFACPELDAAVAEKESAMLSRRASTSLGSTTSSFLSSA